MPGYLPYSETPVSEIRHQLLEEKGVRLLVKREDLNHTTVSGNKWWKLKYNLLRAVSTNASAVLTFGGAFSNHIYATASAARLLNLKSVGVIRGEEILPLNPTLSFARDNGMHLHFISREAYRRKNDLPLIESIRQLSGDVLIIPEGGTNRDALKGTSEFARKIDTISFDQVFLPVGTAGTLAGLIAGLNGHRKIIGVPVYKCGDSLEQEIEDMVFQFSEKIFNNWALLRGYEFGGYAKADEALVAFMREMTYNHQLPLDHVYTAKLLFSIMNEIASSSFPRGTTILAIHTGGLQGAIKV